MITTGLAAPASVRDLELESAERELVRVGREELAWLFRQAALRELFDGEGTGLEMMRGREVDAVNKPVERTDIQRQALRSEWTGLEALDVQDVLQAWLHETSPHRPTAAALAAASMRFAPCQQAKALAGLDYALRGNPCSAEEWLWASLQVQPRSKRSVPSWNNLALTHLRQGRLDLALAASQRVIVIEPMNIIARGGAVVCAALLQNKMLLRFSARELDMVESTDSTAISTYAATLRYQRRSGALRVSSQVSRLAQEHEREFNASGRILHELV